MSFPALSSVGFNPGWKTIPNSGGFGVGRKKENFLCRVRRWKFKGFLGLKCGFGGEFGGGGHGTPSAWHRNGTKARKISFFCPKLSFFNPKPSPGGCAELFKYKKNPKTARKIPNFSFPAPPGFGIGVSAVPKSPRGSQIPGNLGKRRRGRFRPIPGLGSGSSGDFSDLGPPFEPKTL